MLFWHPIFNAAVQLFACSILAQYDFGETLIRDIIKLFFIIQLVSHVNQSDRKLFK
jgi:hypothetical protein